MTAAKAMTHAATEKRKVTIIGAGIVGMACAVNLLRDGHEVTVVDRCAPGEGTSFGNAGVMAPSAFVPVMTPGIIWKVPKMLFDPLGPLSLRWSYLPRMVPWLLRYLRNSSRARVEGIADALSTLLAGSVEVHQRLAAGTGAEPWVRPSDYIYVYIDDAEYAADAYAWRMRRERGARFELIRDGEIRELEPALSDRFRLAVMLKDHGHTPDPARLCKALAAFVARSGGTVLRREVEEIEIGPDGPRRLLADGEVLDLDLLVIAAGAWSGRLARKLGTEIPLEAERGYHVTVQNPGVAPTFPIMCSSGKFVATPMETGLRFAGLVEFGGLDAPPNYKRARTLLKHAATLFPGIDTSSYTEWMGHRPATPDSLPVIDRSPVFPSVYFAFGHQHVGLTGAPRTGELIADLIAGRRPNIDLGPFRADRF